MSAELALRATGIYLATEELTELPESNSDDIVISFDSNLDDEEFEEDIEFSGQISVRGANLKVLLNGNFDKALNLVADEDGRWYTVIPIRNPGTTPYVLSVCAPE